jgi:radical SAM protein with 4Fe4S-binding SPASM domain
MSEGGFKTMSGKESENRIDAHKRLTHIDLEITRKCNLDCIHCSAASKTRGEEMSVDFVKKTLQEAKSMGLEKVGLTGGEPFLNREKLMKIAGFCREELSIPIHIHSNGTLISEQDAEWIKRIEAEITIAVYGNTAAIHDNITRTKGSFSSTLLGLKNLVKAKADVCVFFVPMKQNLHSIEPLIEIVQNEGVKRFRVLSLSPTGRAKAQFQNLELSEEDTQAFNDELSKAEKKANIEINCGFCTSQVLSGVSILKGHEQCFAAENRIHIDTAGNVFPCTASSGRIIFSAGNLQMPENSLESIWTDSPLLQFFRNFHRNPPKKCKICKKYNICMSGCRVKMSYKYGDVTIANPTCGGPYN